MSNFSNFNQNQTPVYQQYYAQQYFLQPQGSIYMIENSSDIANVPVGAGVSAAICLREGSLYLKTFQNGAPMLMIYRLSPIENNTGNTSNANSTSQQDKEEENKKIITILEEYGDRLEKLEKSLKNNKPSKGGVSEWPV